MLETGLWSLGDHDGMDAADYELLFIGPSSSAGNDGSTSFSASRRQPSTPLDQGTPDLFVFAIIHFLVHLEWASPGPTKSFILVVFFIPQFAFLTTSIEEIKKNQVVMVFSSIHPTIRTVQVVCALIALITTAGGYLELSNGQLSSAAAIYAEIANYSAMLCGLFYAVGLGVFKNHVRTPTVAHQRLIDGLLVIALVIGGIVHLTSEAVRDCSSINSMFLGIHGQGLFSCSKMTTGIVLTFVSAALFLITLVWSYMTASAATPANEEEPPAAVAMGYAEAGTPGLKADLIGSEQTELSAKRLHTLRLARRSGRVLQLVTSVAALVTTVAGYRHYYTGQYVSVSATTTILITYTGVVYSFWQVMAVESFQLCRAPKVSVERFVDGVLAVALVVAGSVFATSSRVKNCDELNDKFAVNHGSDLFRCGAMDSGVVFAYVAVAMFLITFALSFAYGKSADVTRNTHTTAEDNVQESQA
ncbi:hypothetical protein FI667_g17380, partial [Globisporangium splendens]